MMNDIASSPSINLNNEEAAEYMRISPRTLEKLRTKSKGPAYHKVGRRVVYVLADLQAYIAQHRCDTTDSAPFEGAVAS